MDWGMDNQSTHSLRTYWSSSVVEQVRLELERDELCRWCRRFHPGRTFLR